MAEFAYEDSEAWHSAVRLAAAVGRLKVASNLKASADAQANAFTAAGDACALIAEASTLSGPVVMNAYQDARAALARTRAWLHVLAAVTNEPDSVFANELTMAELTARQIAAILRTVNRGSGGGMAPPQRGGPPPPRSGGFTQGGRPPGPMGPR